MTTYSDIVKDEATGQPVANVSIYVYNLDKSLATITPTNPVITDSYGEFSFTAADGMYRVSYVVGGKTVEKDYIIVGVGPSIPNDVVAALIPFQNQINASVLQSGTSAAASGTSAGQAAASAIQAGLYAAAAAITAEKVFSAANDGVSNGVINTASLVAGSSGTNGTFAVAFSGGGGTGAAATFVVAGGALTQITITSKGINYTSAPTMSFAASSGLSGASATAVIGPRTANGETYLVNTGSSLEVYKNVSGTATDQGWSLPSAAAVNSEDTRALLAALPRGAIGVWPYDRLSGGSIPNLADGTSNLAISSGSVTAGVLTGKGTITFPAAQTMNEFTAQTLIQVTAINGNNIIFYNTANSTDFSFHSVSSLGGGAPLGVAVSPRTYNNFLVGHYSANTQVQRGGFLNLVGKGYHILTIRQTAAGETSYWIDDIHLLAVDTAPANPLTFTNLTFGVGPDAVTSPHNYAGFLALWDRALSDEEVRVAAHQQKARSVTNGIYPAGRTDRIFIAEGDSNHGPHDANCWNWQFAPNDSPENLGGSYAVAGSTVGGLQARADIVDKIIPPQLYGRKFILSVGIGTNDLPGYDTTTVTTTLIPAVRAYMMARKAAGWTLAMFTVPRRGDLAGAAATNFENVRAIFNADILANPTLYGLAGVGQVIDIGSATGIGSSFDSTKYAADLLHFSATGGAQIEALARPVINAL